jgi:phosphomethylpyrimidine synthase
MCGPKHCPMQTKITDEDLAGLEQADYLCTELH